MGNEGLGVLNMPASMPKLSGILKSVLMYDGFSASGVFSIGGSLGTTPGPNNGGPQRRQVNFNSTGIYTRTDSRAYSTRNGVKFIIKY